MLERLSPQTPPAQSARGRCLAPSGSSAPLASSASRLLSPLATSHSLVPSKAEGHGRSGISLPPCFLPPCLGSNRHKLPFKTSRKSLKTTKSGTR